MLSQISLFACKEKRYPSIFYVLQTEAILEVFRNSTSFFSGSFWCCEKTSLKGWEFKDGLEWKIRHVLLWLLTDASVCTRKLPFSGSRAGPVRQQITVLLFLCNYNVVYSSLTTCTISSAIVYFHSCGQMGKLLSTACVRENLFQTSSKGMIAHNRSVCNNYNGRIVTKPRLLAKFVGWERLRWSLAGFCWVDHPVKVKQFIFRLYACICTVTPYLNDI